MGRMWLPECKERKLQCPNCEHVFPSEKRQAQCAKCHFRFHGDEYPFKTLDNRKEERKKHDKMLDELENKLKDMVIVIQTIRKDLKPLN